MIIVEPVSLCHNVFHLTARSGSWQTRRSSELRISPPPSVMTERIDYFGNTATFATIEEPHRELSVDRRQRRRDHASALLLNPS